MFYQIVGCGSKITEYVEKHWMDVVFFLIALHQHNIHDTIQPLVNISCTIAEEIV